MESQTMPYPQCHGQRGVSLGKLHCTSAAQRENTAHSLFAMMGQVESLLQGKTPDLNTTGLKNNHRNLLPQEGTEQAKQVLPNSSRVSPEVLYAHKEFLAETISSRLLQLNTI